MRIKNYSLFILLILFVIVSPLPASASLNESYNPGFEKDLNHNQIPDFWEINWLNGNSNSAYVKQAPYEPAEGSYHNRLYNGIGDINAYQYVISNPIPINGGVIYKAQAYMRYTVAAGGRAEFTIIQFDAHGNNISENHAAYTNGGWTWHDQTLTFSTKPNAAYINIRFAIGGEEDAYLDVDKVRLEAFDYNGGFEQDEDLTSKPDFWEVFWRNGSSIDAYAKQAPYEPFDGQLHYRLFSGAGDPSSEVFAVSSPIPVPQGFSYLLNAQMRYTLASGGKCTFSILEQDASGAIINEIHHDYKDGGWQWNDKHILYQPLPATHSIVIRFGIGGESESYLDIDQFRLTPIQSGSKFQYLYDNNGRITYTLLPQGKIIHYLYDRNGNLFKKHGVV
ncbi:hypothetical protein [Paenibacillus lutrae]|uniref:CBM-cenC domain-containing protein n=1 Tax=Paenibacillus lutrae TaxID=2078573 RepID=A0A7X3FMQ2_9BACL|nr:hypothetical protein [Paenibacillus lutrae]MVP02576.1 hypothetical protein [Paenibacillus lutrae]